MNFSENKFRILKLILITNLVLAFLYWILCNDNSHFDGNMDDENETQLGKLYNRFYFSVNVTSTLGMTNTPKSKMCKLLVIIQITVLILNIFDFTKDITM